MKTIVFPATSRVHLARQALLLDELKKYFEVDIFEPTTKREGNASIYSLLCAIEFNNFLTKKKYDLMLARGDRYEVLPLAIMAAYRGISIAHIEGGDLSSVIDNKVRHAITHLSDYHFCTNEESHARLIAMGINPNKVWNFGSLDVEFAMKVKDNQLRDKKYILVTYHPIAGEDKGELEEALKKYAEYDVIKIVSNNDYGASFGDESYAPEDFINLMRHAVCCVGNSSALLKEASILGVPVVNVGHRQDKRLKPRNVLDTECKKENIERAIDFQMTGDREKDLTYWQPDTSINIALKLRDLI